MISFKKASVLLLLISGLAFSFLTPINFLINFAHDDSFFYIKTALNFSRGFGSTFDQVNITNGYHPLWFMILVLYFFILNLFKDFSPEYIFRFISLLQIIISSSTIYFVSKFFQRIDSNYKEKILLFIPLYIVLVFTRDFGMESQLTCLIFSVYCYLKSEELFINKNFTAAKSFLLCLLFLARVDYLFSIIPFMIAFDYYTLEGKFKSRFLLLSLSCVIVTAISYFLFNKISYGYFLTISAISKSTFPDFVLIQNLDNFTSPGPLLIHLLKSICILAVILLFLFSKKNVHSVSGKLNIFLFGSCCGTLFFIILNFCFNNNGLREWYVTLPAFAALLLFINSSGFRVKHFRIKFVMLIIFASVYFYLVRMNNFKWDTVYDYALNLKKVTGSDDRIFQIDFSGVTGFFSERKLINGDGLINSFEYRDYLAKGRLKEYFKDKRINLYSTNSEEEIKLIPGLTGLYTDTRYSNKFGGYDFIFRKEDLVFTMPFSYDHALRKVKGDWYLFKIPE